MTALALPTLWPHQARAYVALRRAARELGGPTGAGAGVLCQAPPGAGKTLIALACVEGVLRRGGRLLYLAPSLELVEQPARKLWEYGLREIRVYSRGGVSGDPTARVTVAGIQTLLAHDAAPEVDVVILDEARHYVAAQWRKIATQYHKAIRIGLDATPVRTDGAALGDLFGAIVVAAQVQELTDAGHLVPIITIAPSRAQVSPAEDPVVAYQKHAQGRRGIFFCRGVPAAHQLAARFNAAGISAEAVDGDTDNDARRGALRRLESGETTIVTNCALFGEGVDLPSIDLVGIDRGVSSISAWLQMIGRGGRAAPGKTHAMLLDLYGHCHRFGFFADDRTYHLNGQAIRRVEGLPPIAQCPACHAWGRGGRLCTACGVEVPAPPPPRVKRAPLSEQQGRNAEQSDEEKQARLLGWVKRETAEGRNAWRAAHVFKGVYGAEPGREWMQRAISEARA